MPAAIAALEDAVVCAVTGQDRTSYLDAVLTQRIDEAPTGSATSGLLLDAHGAPLLVVDVVVLEDRILLVAPAPLRDELDRLLARRTFLADARFAWQDELSVVRLMDPADAQLPVELPPVGTARDTELGLAVSLARGPLLLVHDAEGALHALEEAGFRRGTSEDLERWDVTNGVPAWGHEIVPGNLPEELGLLPTHVHLAKGCYPGQEAVARMWMLGRPRRRLAVVVPDPGVEAGWESGGGRKGARVTRRVDTPEGPRALAFVPPDVEVGQRVSAEEGPGIEVQHLVGSDREVVGHDPAMTRRRDRS